MIILLQKLIQISSENNGVTGYEKEVHRFYQDWLKEHGIPAEWIELETIPGFDQHPVRLLEYDMRNRPLVIARMQEKCLGKKTFAARACRYGSGQKIIPISNDENCKNRYVSSTWRITIGKVYPRILVKMHHYYQNDVMASGYLCSGK
ncbi:MAG: hypothetical protein WCT05_02610 [Lentisphaeria bacterium]